MASLLLIDDDVELTGMLSMYLEGEGFAVGVMNTTEGALAAATSGTFDAVILDVMLPGILGSDLLHLIRQRSDVPVIMLTAKGDNTDRVQGLELGADDYVPKPYYPPELVARIRAVLRRHAGRAGQAKNTQYAIANLQVDVEARKVSTAAGQVELTSSEFNLLTSLLRAMNRVATKEELSLLVLGRPRAAYDRSIDVHVSNLRQKLAAAQAKVVLENVRGVGYRIVASP